MEEYKDSNKNDERDLQYLKKYRKLEVNEKNLLSWRWDKMTSVQREEWIKNYATDEELIFLSTRKLKKTLIQPGENVNGAEFVEYTRPSFGISNRNEINWYPRGKFICSDCGKIYEKAVDSVRRNKNIRCPDCAKKHKGRRFLKKGDAVGPHNIVFVEYIESKPSYPKANFICPFCGKIFSSEVKYIKNGDIVSCGCKRQSMGEKIIEDLLKELNIKYEAEMVMPNRQRLDFYLSDYNIAIEFDGEQHYEECGMCRDTTLEQRQAKDREKNKWCIDNGIKLIRIPYWDKLLITKEYMLERINNPDKYCVK